MRVISFVFHLVTAVHRFQFMFVTKCTPKNCRLVGSDRYSDTDNLTGPKCSLREVSMEIKDPIFAVKVNAVLVSE